VQSSSKIDTTNKPTASFLQAGCPSGRQTNSVRALKSSVQQKTHAKCKLHGRNIETLVLLQH